MKTKLFLIILISCYLIILFSCTECSFNLSGDKEITILSYNVENLFDDVDNGSEYSSYDPGGEDWNIELYHSKLMQISEVIGRAVRGGPDILAMQEVENSNVLNALKDDYLKGMGYLYSVITPAEDSAVNTVLLSRIPVTSYTAHRVSINGKAVGRNIIEANFNYDGKLLTVFNNHWKSKSGGVEKTEKERLETAALIRRRLSALYSGNPELDIVILGDLNENIDEYLRIGMTYQTALIPFDAEYPEYFAEKSLLITGEMDKASGSDTGFILYSPWNNSDYKGSYVYRDSWETIDHFLLNSSLFDNSAFTYSGFSVIREDFMLTDSAYPRRWNSESASGYSDHLPILLRLVLN